MTRHDFSILDIVRAVAPDRNDLVALVHAYFDESGEGEFFVVGGFIFRKSKISRFEKSWRRMLIDAGLDYFHMTDCNAAKGQYEALGEIGCDIVARKAIKIITEHAEHAYYCAVRVADFDKQTNLKKMFQNPYQMCAYFCLVGSGVWADNYAPNSLISYFFESGYKDQNSAQSAISALTSYDSEHAHFKYRSHSFVSKKSSFPTQAADMLAWHANKHLKRTSAGHLGTRGDFAEILKSVGFTFFHIRTAEMEKMVSAINKKAGGPGGVTLAGMLINNGPTTFLRDPDLRASILRGES